MLLCTRRAACTALLAARRCHWMDSLLYILFFRCWPLMQNCSLSALLPAAARCLLWMLLFAATPLAAIPLLLLRLLLRLAVPFLLSAAANSLLLLLVRLVSLSALLLRFLLSLAP